MGACNCSSSIDQQEKISKSSYNFSYAVGQGGFGKVWKVVDKKTKEVYALKIMEKHKILTKKSVQSVINEKNILQEIQDDFIVNMKMAFQDKESLYLVLEYLDGGDLRYHLNKCYEYSEEETQFIAASIIQGLEKVHNHNIIHRDLKPENIVFSSNGQLKITDFGIARYYRPDNADQTSGTPGYMAPEVLMKCSHDFLVDYYALGVILFEIIYGERPYLGRNRKEIKQQVLQVQRYLSMDDLPDETWSLESADFVNQLIKRKPANRLGAKGIQQIKNHPWLKNFPWQNLKNGTLQNPFKPKLPEGKPGGSFVNLKVNQAEQQKDRESMRLLRRNSTQRLFQDFDYDPMGILKNQDNKQQENRQDSPTKNQTIAQSAQTIYNSTIEFGSSSKKPLTNRLINSQNSIQIQSISKLVGNDQKQREQKQKLEQIIRQKQRQRMQNEVQNQNQNQKQKKHSFNQQEIKSTQQNNQKNSYSQNQSNRKFFNEKDSQNEFQNKPRGLSFQTKKRTYSKNLYQNKTPIKRIQNSILGHKLENKERKSFSSFKKQEQQQEQQQQQFSQELQNEQKKEINYVRKMGYEGGSRDNFRNFRKSLDNSINSIENGKEDQENQGLIQENEKYNQISQIHDSQLIQQIEQGVNQRQNNHKNINKNQHRKINMSRQSLMSQDLNQSQIRMHTDEVREDSPLKR